MTPDYSTKSSLYFDTRDMAKVSAQFVIWVDAMGTAMRLKTSLNVSANFVMKLHQAFSIAKVSISHKSDYKSLPEVLIFPIMDGMYITCTTFQQCADLLKVGFLEISKEFINTKDFQHKFMIRAGVAYGPTIAGSNIANNNWDGSNTSTNKKTEVVSTYNSVRSALLFSPAMVDAHNCEALASPFGVHVHESAITIPQIAIKQTASNNVLPGFPTSMYRWFRSPGVNPVIIQSLKQKVKEHLDECALHSRELRYPIEKIQTHISVFDEYFISAP